jgi:hypothetical protein
MLEKTDVKRSRTGRANGSLSSKPTTSTPSGKTTAGAKTPAVAPFGLKLQR